VEESVQQTVNIIRNHPLLPSYVKSTDSSSIPPQGK